MTLRNPELAKTLKLIAKKGPEAFYTGAIANSIIDSVTKSAVAPGDMTLADLAAYKAVEQNAVCAPYRVYMCLRHGTPFVGRDHGAADSRLARTLRHEGNG
jgi:gamma-glutamyltranspeptidase/glutathione hydrolase